MDNQISWNGLQMLLRRSLPAIVLHLMACKHQDNKYSETVLSILKYTNEDL